jgi:hypothetical protein
MGMDGSVNVDSGWCFLLGALVFSSNPASRSHPPARLVI